ISIISTTGFTTADYTLWPYLCQMLLLCLMFIGGCSSSTSGGVKAIRILVVIRYIRYGIHTRLHPNSVEPISINGQAIPSGTVSGVTYHIFLYIAMMFAGAFLLSLENIGLEDSFSSVITCMGNIGPSFGKIGAMGTFSGLHWFSKLTLSAEMLAGRLELYTLFILFTPRFWNPNN
ncbi:MAG: TrkH family potassium uptake protein, partial [Firmicutes bacterium]|nr:TrkH family potassium uptake protein [Bacillota bacterium]